MSPKQIAQALYWLEGKGVIAHDPDNKLTMDIVSYGRVHCDGWSPQGKVADEAYKNSLSYWNYRALPWWWKLRRKREGCQAELIPSQQLSKRP